MTDASVARDEMARLPMIDAVRGFALLGIFLMNLGGFTGFAELTRDERAFKGSRIRGDRDNVPACH